MAALPDARGRLGRAGCGPASASPGQAEIALLAGYGVVAGLGYGVALDFAFWPFTTGAGTQLSFVPGGPAAANLHRFVVYAASTSLGWDIGRAVTNAVLIVLTGRAVLGTLRRAARRAAFAGTEQSDTGLCQDQHHGSLARPGTRRRRAATRERA